VIRLATCGECGMQVTDWGLHVQTWPHAKTGMHAHLWVMGQVTQETEYGQPWYVRAAYLYCQCGAVKRTIVQEGPEK
jgi:hypothetical protein